MTFVDLFSGKEKLQQVGGCGSSLPNDVDFILELGLKLGKWYPLLKKKEKHSTLKNYPTTEKVFSFLSTPYFLSF